MEKVLRLLIDLKETIFDRIDLKDLNFIFSTVPQPYSVLFNQPHKTLVETKSTSNHHHWSQPSSEPSSQPSAQPSSQPSSQPSHRNTCLIIVTNPYNHECSSSDHHSTPCQQTLSFSRQQPYPRRLFRLLCESICPLYCCNMCLFVCLCSGSQNVGYVCTRTG